MNLFKIVTIPRFIGVALIALSTMSCVRLTEPRKPAVIAGSPSVIAGTPAVATEPILALWCNYEGRVRPEGTRAPYLRFAIWDDGRMVLAVDPQKWGKELLEGELTSQQIAEVKQVIRNSSVASLTRSSYLVPDANVYCIAVIDNGRKYILEWDECEVANYGMMAHFGPDEQTFVKCWHKLNQAGVKTHPATSSPSQFQEAITSSWTRVDANIRQ